MSRDQAIALARRVAAAEGWTWLAPVEATLARGPDAHGPRWIVTSNASARGCNVRVTIDDATGQIVSTSFAPR